MLYTSLAMTKPAAVLSVPTGSVLAVPAVPAVRSTIQKTVSYNLIVLAIVTNKNCK